MGQWQALPPGTTPELRHLVLRLRDLKDRSGLGLAALATKTACSKSAWSRYLNGQAFPPREVVAALGAVVGAERERLIAAWELADRARSEAAPPAVGTATVEPAPAPAGRDAGESAALPAGDSAAGRSGRGLVVGAVLAVVGAVFAGVALAGVLNGPGASEARDGVPQAASAEGGTAGPCHAESCAGRDPVASGCDLDAVTTGAAQVAAARVVLRFSASCQSEWGELTSAALYDRITVTDAQGRTADAKVRSGAAVATPMLAATTGQHAVACGHLSASHGAEGCTSAPTVH